MTGVPIHGRTGKRLSSSQGERPPEKPSLRHLDLGLPASTGLDAPSGGICYAASLPMLLCSQFTAWVQKAGPASPHMPRSRVRIPASLPAPSQGVWMSAGDGALSVWLLPGGVTLTLTMVKSTSTRQCVEQCSRLVGSRELSQIRV